MRREDERLCKREFTEYLRSRGVVDLSWDDGDDPPDYDLIVSNVRYAVEVTNMMENVDMNGQHMSHLGFRRTVTKFLKGVEEEARQAGILSGPYSVRCKPRDDFRRNRKRVEQRLLKYIKDTQLATDPPAEDILGRGYFGWSISKLKGERLFLIPSISGAKWQVDAQKELCELLDNVLAIKISERTPRAEARGFRPRYNPYCWSC